MGNRQSGVSSGASASVFSHSRFPIPHSRLHLLYGGTFDPIHDGHLAIARAARDELRTTVWLMPAADPPHRPAPGADARQRAAMLALAIGDEPGLRVDLRELRRAERDPEARSYTIDTLRELRGEFGINAPLAMLIGADSFIGLPSWRQWRELFELAHIVIAERPGSPLDDGLPPELAAEAAGRWCDDANALAAAPAGGLFCLHQPLHAESATGIRQRIAAGQPWRDGLPPPVAEYITAHGLYRQAAL
ncbi:MAG: nicotinate-nucleotide adenylyltransferase [Pseudoxanthomonas sp.]